MENPSTILESQLKYIFEITLALLDAHPANHHARQ